MDDIGHQQGFDAGKMIDDEDQRPAGNVLLPVESNAGFGKIERALMARPWCGRRTDSWAELEKVSSIQLAKRAQLMSIDTFTINENSPAINFVEDKARKLSGRAMVDTAVDSI